MANFTISRKTYSIEWDLLVETNRQTLPILYMDCVIDRACEQWFKWLQQEKDPECNRGKKIWNKCIKPRGRVSSNFHSSF